MAATGTHSNPRWDRVTSSPWTGWIERARDTSVYKSPTGQGPRNWLSRLGEFLLAALLTVAALPVMALGILVTLVLSAWAILLPALIAGLVIVIVSFLGA